MIETQPFGRTGHESTRIIFGAAALAQASQGDADRTLEVLLRHGINHIDVAASYGDAELRIGPWMDRHRQDFFLATKTGERSYEKAMDQIQRSLERLQTDCIDLIQLHNLVDPVEWQQALGPGGALEAAVEARRQGMVRFIGVTGHGTPIAAMHARSLERFAFDAVLLPYSYVVMRNEKYAADFEALMATCAGRGVAVQTIKSIARRPWGDSERAYTTWYEPLDDQGDIDLAVHWVLNRPGVFLNTVSDVTLLMKVLDAAERFRPAPSMAPLDEELARLELVPLFV
jgi:aryl-alcohol dehydrogenase-like predicted oxidoreductase